MAILKHVLPKEIPEPDPELDPLEWNDCRRTAELFTNSKKVIFKCPPVVDAHLASHPRAALSRQLGAKASSWALTMEVQACSAAGIKGAKCAPYLGRGQFPKLVMTPILEKMTSPRIGETLLFIGGLPCQP
eukprot:12002279-Heterocapsa_arctica.AAC.1